MLLFISELKFKTTKISHLKTAVKSNPSLFYPEDGDTRSYKDFVTTHQNNGRALAQAVCRRLPTAAARVRAQSRSCWICGGQGGNWAGCLQVIRFPLPILIPPNAPYSSIIWVWYNRPISGRRTKWTQFHPNPRNQKKKGNLPDYIESHPLTH
jgi:hypothetical protein